MPSAAAPLIRTALNPHYYQRVTLVLVPDSGIRGSRLGTLIYTTPSLESVVTPFENNMRVNFFLLLITAASAFGQVTSGSISGFVFDPSERIIRGATVTVTS